MLITSALLTANHHANPMPSFPPSKPVVLCTKESLIVYLPLFSFLPLYSFVVVVVVVVVVVLIPHMSEIIWYFL